MFQHLLTLKFMKFNTSSFVHLFHCSCSSHTAEKAQNGPAAAPVSPVKIFNPVNPGSGAEIGLTSQYVEHEHLTDTCNYQQATGAAMPFRPDVYDSKCQQYAAGVSGDLFYQHAKTDQQRELNQYQPSEQYTYANTGQAYNPVYSQQYVGHDRHQDDAMQQSWPVTNQDSKGDAVLQHSWHGYNYNQWPAQEPHSGALYSGENYQSLSDAQEQMPSSEFVSTNLVHSTQTESLENNPVYVQNQTCVEGPVSAGQEWMQNWDQHYQYPYQGGIAGQQEIQPSPGTSNIENMNAESANRSVQHQDASVDYWGNISDKPPLRFDTDVAENITEAAGTDGNKLTDPQAQPSTVSSFFGRSSSESEFEFISKENEEAVSEAADLPVPHLETDLLSRQSSISNASLRTFNLSRLNSYEGQLEQMTSKMNPESIESTTNLPVPQIVQGYHRSLSDPNINSEESESVPVRAEEDTSADAAKAVAEAFGYSHSAPQSVGSLQGYFSNPEHPTASQGTDENVFDTVPGVYNPAEMSVPVSSSTQNVDEAEQRILPYIAEASSIDPAGKTASNTAQNKSIEFSTSSQEDLKLDSSSVNSVHSSDSKKSVVSNISHKSHEAYDLQHSEEVIRNSSSEINQEHSLGSEADSLLVESRGKETADSQESRQSRDTDLVPLEGSMQKVDTSQVAVQSHSKDAVLCRKPGDVLEQYHEHPSQTQQKIQSLFPEAMQPASLLQSPEVCTSSFVFCPITGNIITNQELSHIPSMNVTTLPAVTSNSDNPESINPDQDLPGVQGDNVQNVGSISPKMPLSEESVANMKDSHPNPREFKIKPTQTESSIQASVPYMIPCQPITEISEKLPASPGSHTDIKTIYPYNVPQTTVLQPAQCPTTDVTGITPSVASASLPQEIRPSICVPQPLKSSIDAAQKIGHVPGNGIGHAFEPYERPPDLLSPSKQDASNDIINNSSFDKNLEGAKDSRKNSRDYDSDKYSSSRSSDKDSITKFRDDRREDKDVRRGDRIDRDDFYDRKERHDRREDKYVRKGDRSDEDDIYRRREERRDRKGGDRDDRKGEKRGDVDNRRGDREYRRSDRDDRRYYKDYQSSEKSSYDDYNRKRRDYRDKDRKDQRGYDDRDGRYKDRRDYGDRRDRRAYDKEYANTDRHGGRRREKDSRYSYDYDDYDYGHNHSRPSSRASNYERDYDRNRSSTDDSLKERPRSRAESEYGTKPRRKDKDQGQYDKYYEEWYKQQAAYFQGW